MNCRLTFLLVLSLASFPKLALAQGVPVDSLYAWYPFSGNTLDSSGKGHNGIGGDLTPAADRFGKQGRAYSFNGTSSYIRSTTFLPDMNEFTVSWWMISDNPGLACVLLEGDGVLYRDLFVSVTGNRIDFRSDKTGPVNITNSVQFANNQQWTHVVATTTPDSLWMYVNDTLKLAKGGSFAQIGYHSLFEIGRIYDYVGNTGSTYFKGVLDDIRIYTRHLTPKEITKLYKEPLTAVARGLQQKVMAAPNPASGSVTLYGLQGPHKLQIRNGLQQLVRSIETAETNPSISTVGLAPGLYTVLIEGEGGLKCLQISKE